MQTEKQQPEQVQQPEAQTEDKARQGTNQPGHDKEKAEEDRLRPGELMRRLFAELIGTFALTLVAAGADMLAVMRPAEVGVPIRAVAPALVIMAMIFTLAQTSGAHFNPGVTLAFAMRRDFPWHRVPFYWIAQFVGAIPAAALLRGLFGVVGHLGANQPHFGIAAPIMEIVLTFFLVTVILGTATGSRIVGNNAAIAVGGTIAFDGLIGIPISGASMNPARSLGPALVGGDIGNLWIYIVCPIVGALLAVGVAWILRGPTTPHAVEAAKGD
jgi:aquaporin Z